MVPVAVAESMVVLCWEVGLFIHRRMLSYSLWNVRRVDERHKWLGFRTSMGTIELLLLMRRSADYQGLEPWPLIVPFVVAMLPC
jgi:hypothetical protein